LYPALSPEPLHRLGLPAVPQADCRWRWDAAQRTAAARLDRVERAWTVLYGVGRRRFYAFAQRTTDEPLIVEAATVEELREMMRPAETHVQRPAAWDRHVDREWRAA